MQSVTRSRANEAKAAMPKGPFEPGAYTKSLYRSHMPSGDIHLDIPPALWIMTEKVKYT